MERLKINSSADKQTLFFIFYLILSSKTFAKVDKGNMRVVLALFLAAQCHGWVTHLHTPRNLNKLESSANDNNVVLRPSEDPSAFDSFRIGSARVHRYMRDSSGTDESAEYVMWYHGRTENFDEEKELPPLTTGRIGRATSNNGLHWEKTIEGNLSEDAPDVSLGLNRESWWGFDTAHVGLGQVLLPMTTPAVMTEGGVYLMCVASRKEIFGTRSLLYLCGCGFSRSFFCTALYV